MRTSIVVGLWVALLGCGDDVAGTDTESTSTTEAGPVTTGDITTAEPTTGEPLGVCAPKTIDVDIWSGVGACTEPSCSAPWASWGERPEQADEPFEHQLEAHCVVNDILVDPEFGEEWTFRECAGDMVPVHGMLGLWWQATPLVPLAIVPGQSVRLRHVAWGDGKNKFQLAWSLQDAGGRPIAAYSRRDDVPAPWLTEPIELRLSTQACAPYEVCEGTDHAANLEVRLGASTAVIPEGNIGVLGDDPVLDVYVFEASIGQGFVCGIYPEYTSLSLAIVAR